MKTEDWLKLKKRRLEIESQLFKEESPKLREELKSINSQIKADPPTLEQVYTSI
jgi:hypothetical protein